MASFTITVTPDDGAGAQTTIRVKTAPGSARITELTVKAAGGGGLSPDELSAVDLDALIAAVAPTGAATLTAVPTGVPAQRSGRRGAGKTADAKVPGARVANGVQPSTGRRAYRRMPEVNEVLDAYRRVGGTTALARYFGVPRHTATGWLRRLRSMGELQP